jgi:hypothetical protein
VMVTDIHRSVLTGQGGSTSGQCPSVGATHPLTKAC